MTLRGRDMMRFSRFISMFCSRPMREHPEIDDVMVLDGFLPVHWTLRDLEPNIPTGFQYVEAWSDGFRSVWTNDAMRACISSVEGDISVAIGLSDIAWAAYRRSARAIYEPPVPA